VNRRFFQVNGLRLLAIAMGGLLIWSAVAKLGDPVGFDAAVRGMRILPVWLVAPCAGALPFLEATLGFWLILGWRRRSASFVLLVLMSIFVVVVFQALLRGLEVECHCFGKMMPGGLPGSLVRDFVLWCGAFLLHAKARALD